MVPLLLDSSNYLYYVTSHDGICSVREINPHNEEKNPHHMVVAEIKSDKCNGLSITGDNMYFLDDRKVVTKLEKQNETRLLNDTDSFKIKEKDRPNFKPSPYYGDNLILTEKYLIEHSKIFFLYQDRPLASGILDMTELCEQEDYENVLLDEMGNQMLKTFANGPFPVGNSEKYFNIYQYGGLNHYKMKFYQKPDSCKYPLLNDL
jgi:hypothetical protein